MLTPRPIAQLESLFGLQPACPYQSTVRAHGYRTNSIVICGHERTE